MVAETLGGQNWRLTKAAEAGTRHRRRCPGTGGAGPDGHMVTSDLGRAGPEGKRLPQARVEPDQTVQRPLVGQDQTL